MRVNFATLAVAAICIVYPAPSNAQNSDPEWIKKPTAESLRAVYPSAALRSGISGRAVLLCEVKERGAADKCVVTEEAPKDKGFGSAALLLAPNFAFKPGMKDGKPVRSEVALPIVFKTSGRLDAPSSRMTAAVFWEKAPTWADLVAANPTALSTDPVSGHVGLRCKINANGGLRDCQAINPLPRGRKFDKAALKLTELFEVVNDGEYRKELNDVYLNFAVNFPDPRQADAPRRLAKLEWKRTGEMSGFPGAALAAGLKSGRAVLECVAAGNGAMEQCKVTSEEPANMGFGDAALVVAKVMQLNPWTLQGEPVDGAQVRLPITIKSPEAEPPK